MPHAKIFTFRKKIKMPKKVAKYTSPVTWDWLSGPMSEEISILLSSLSVQ